MSPNDSFVGLGQPSNWTQDLFGAFSSSESLPDLEHWPAMAYFGYKQQFSVPGPSSAPHDSSSTPGDYQTASTDNEIPPLILDSPLLRPHQHGSVLRSDLVHAQNEQQQQQQHQQQPQQGFPGQDAMPEDCEKLLRREEYQQFRHFERYETEQDQGQHHTQQIGVTGTIQTNRSSTPSRGDLSRDFASQIDNFASVSSSGRGHWPQMNCSLSAPLGPNLHASDLAWRSPTPLVPTIPNPSMAYTTRGDGISRTSSSLRGKVASSRLHDRHFDYPANSKTLKDHIRSSFAIPASSPPPMAVSRAQQEFPFDWNGINPESRPCIPANHWDAPWTDRRSDHNSGGEARRLKEQAGQLTDHPARSVSSCGPQSC